LLVGEIIKIDVDFVFLAEFSKSNLATVLAEA
jgi:hypothetical protein